MAKGRQQASAQPGRRSRRRKLLLAVLFAVLVGTVLEGIGYLVWRLFLGEEKRNSISALCGDGKVQPRRRPNTFWHHDLNPEHERYRGVANPKGLKGPDFPVRKPEGEFRVICLGDSTTEGTGVEPDETYPHLLEGMLRNAPARGSPSRSVRVINAGIGSHNSAFNLAHLAFRLIHWDPDAVVIKSTYNDYLPFVVPEMGADYSHAFPEPYYCAKTDNPFWSFARHSSFLKVVGSVLFRKSIKDRAQNFSGRITSELFAAMDYEANEDKLYVYAENIRSMILLLKHRGVRVFLLDMPTSPDPYHFGEDKAPREKFKALIAMLETEARSVAKEEDVPFLDTGPLLAGDFWDHCHNTASGNLKIAERVRNAILPLLR